MKRLYLATLQMALDRENTGQTNISWPGDTGASFTNWVDQLARENYISRADLCKLLSAPEVIVATNDPLTNNPSGGILNPKAKPYGGKCFIVYRKAGDGAILQPCQAGMTNVIGGYVPLCN